MLSVLQEGHSTDVEHSSTKPAFQILYCLNLNKIDENRLYYHGTGTRYNKAEGKVNSYPILLFLRSLSFM